MEKLAAILLMGGSSNRFGGPKNKLLCELNNKRVFEYSLDVFASIKEFEMLYVVANKEIKEEVKNYIDEKAYKAMVIEGGETRQDSVEAALVRMQLNSNYKVVIHDAARPLVNKDIIFKVLEGLEGENVGGATTYLPMSDTIVITDQGYIVNFPNRSKYVQVQTPQAFWAGPLYNGHHDAEDLNATDDCSLVFESGYYIKLVEGNKKLHKITTLEDIKYLEGLLK